MQRITILLLLVLSYQGIAAQQFSADFGKVISKFDYTNSEGGRLENIQGNTDNHIAIGFNLPLRNSDLYFMSGVSYDKYGAKGSDDLLGNYYDWKVNYVGVNLGVGYEFLRSNSQRNMKNINSEESFTIFVQVSGGADFMVQGTQTLDNQVYSLKGVEQFDKPLIFAKGGLGVKYYATRAIFVFVQYMGGKSFAVFKPSSDDQEKLNIITHTMSIGLGINLPALNR